MPPEGRTSRSDPGLIDWAGDGRTFAMLWGLPGAAMLAAAFLGPVPRAVIWTTMLLWMAGACLANASRCGRTHCRITGPFFIVMAAGVVAHSNGLLGLGRHGWIIIGAVALLGSASLWWASERLWGRYSG